MVSINISEAPHFRSPQLLQHPPIPRGLAGVNPRTIKGKEWWDIVRKEAYQRNNFCCWACARARLDSPGRLLDAHECYTYIYLTRVATFDEVVALCRDCHHFIHFPKVPAMRPLKRILQRGLTILHESSLELPRAQVHIARRLHLNRKLPFLDTDRILPLANLTLKEAWALKANLSTRWKLEFEGKLYVQQLIGGPVVYERKV